MTTFDHQFNQLKKLAADAGKKIKQLELKLSIAESCTGGGLCYLITSVPGSSAWFERGFVTYSDQSKIELLGVKPQTLASCGAVSKEVAAEMAEGALQHSSANLSIAVTGIAGPGGGSIEKPVGTVWIALSTLTPQGLKTQSECTLFTGDREMVRLQVIETSLKKLLT